MRLTIRDLERETGLQRRTIHYWSHQGLLPSPNGSGPSATYGEEHLLRLRLIPAFKIAGLRLDRIGCALDRLRLDEMRRLVEENPGAELQDPHRVATWLRGSRRRSVAATPEPEAPDGCRRWLRRRVSDGLEIHFCADSAGDDRQFEDKLRRLDETLRELFEGFGE